MTKIVDNVYKLSIMHTANRLKLIVLWLATVIVGTLEKSEKFSNYAVIVPQSV